METDKRSNLEHHVKEAITLAITTVCSINIFFVRIVSGESVLD